MSLIKRCQRETLVYWPLIGTLPTGESVWGPPAQYTCRWDDKVKEVIGPHGDRVMSQVEIISEIRLVVGGLVKRGSIAGVTYWDNPKLNADVYEVLISSDTPNLRGSESLYEACA